NIANVATASTSAESIHNPDGSVSVKTIAQTAGISLFDGAIVAKAVTTTNIATVHPDHTISSSINTEFVGLKIGAKAFGLNVPQNFHVIIPNIANVVLKAGFPSGDNTSGTISRIGAGLYVSLLKPR